MKLFAKKEILGALAIFTFVFVADFVGFRISIRRERDSQRKFDITALEEALNLYKKDYGSYPLSSGDGRIIACEGPDSKVKTNNNGIPVRSDAGKVLLENLVPCEWGEDVLMDVIDKNYPHYLDVIPKDPESDRGDYYLYYSSGDDFIIFGSFEGKTEIEYSKEVRRAKISCGRRFCNFAKFAPKSTLDKMLKEYENEYSGNF